MTLIKVLKTLFQPRNQYEKVKPLKSTTKDYIYQYLDKDIRTLYIDYDNTQLHYLLFDLNDVQKRISTLQKGRIPKIYVVKNNKKNNYHIYCKFFMKDIKGFISELKYADSKVYGKTQLFRLPYSEEPQKVGIYNEFYIYQNGKLVENKNVKLSDYVIYEK